MGKPSPDETNTNKKKTGTAASSTRPAWTTVWWTAARPHTLTASLSPCIISFASTTTTNVPWHWWLAWTVFCATVQIGTNLHNDYSDYVQGADSKEKRVGQPRATAQGWLTPEQTCRAATFVLSITALAGLYLIHVANQWDNPVVWFFVVSSLFNAFAYTGGPYPLGYLGLGHVSWAYWGVADVFVLVYFGYVAVLMVPYLSGQVPLPWSAGTQVGVLATTIIIVNNLRDRHGDALVGKRTTAVRFGRTFSLLEYGLCHVTAYGLLVADWYLYWAAQQQQQQDDPYSSLWWLLPLLSLPLAVREFRTVGCKEGADLNPHVGGAAKVQFLYCLLWALGRCLSTNNGETTITTGS